MLWNPMETCPEWRPVFVRTKISPIYIATRTDRDSVQYEDGSFGRISNLTGWHPCLAWQTGLTPRVEGWFLVTWGENVTERVRWIATESRWWSQYNRVIPETWLAWTWDLPDFVPQPKAAEPTSDLASKSVDEIVGEIKRLTDHLAVLLKSE